MRALIAIAILLPIPQCMPGICHIEKGSVDDVGINVTGKSSHTIIETKWTSLNFTVTGSCPLATETFSVTVTTPPSQPVPTKVPDDAEPPIEPPPHRTTTPIIADVNGPMPPLIPWPHPSSESMSNITHVPEPTFLANPAKVVAAARSEDASTTSNCEGPGNACVGDVTYWEGGSLAPPHSPVSPTIS